MWRHYFASRITLQSPLHRSSPKFLIGSALVTHFCHMRSDWLACCHQGELSYHMFSGFVIICLLVIYIDTCLPQNYFTLFQFGLEGHNISKKPSHIINVQRYSIVLFSCPWAAWAMETRLRWHAAISTNVPTLKVM